MLRAATNAKHSRVYSSTTDSHFRLWPRAVRSKMRPKTHATVATVAQIPLFPDAATVFPILSWPNSAAVLD